MPEIAQDSWEFYRKEIRMLYLEKGMSLDKIRTEMDKNYGFCPSKSQYETAFRKWNFRKNLTHSDWEFVEHRIKKRKAEDKETELYLNDKLIPPKRVKKELNRHFTPSYTQWYTTAPSPQTPQDIAIRTPKNPATFEIRLGNLPWFQFQEMLESDADLNQDLISQMFDAGERRVRTAFPDTTRSTEPDLGFSAQGNPYQLGSRANITTPATSSIFAGLVPLSTKLGSVGYIPAVHSFMQAISLEKNDGDFELSVQKLYGPFNRDALTEFLKYAAYLSSNNMLSDDQSDRFLRWVVETNNHPTLQAFFSVKMLTVEAFARYIFESALRIGDAAVLRILLKAGVDPGPPTRALGLTPLQVVARDGNMELARILLAEGVCVNAISGYENRTALRLAVEKADVEMVRMLLDAGADVNHVSWGPVHVSWGPVLEGAIHFGRLGRLDPDATSRIVQMLLDAGADVEAPVCLNNGTTALQAAAQSGNIELVQFLLDAGADVNAPAALPSRYGGQLDEGTVFQQVAGGEEYELSIELARLLLGAGADINAPASWDSSYFEHLDGLFCGATALQAAVMGNNAAVVRVLLDAGADVNASAGRSDHGRYRMTALQAVAYDGLYGMTALQAAAYDGRVEIAQMLLDAGAEVNAQASYCYDEDGDGIFFPCLPSSHGDEDDGDDHGHEYAMTALQGAASSGSAELVRMLLGAGAAVNAPAGRNSYESERSNALERAAESGSVELVHMLLDAGADVNVPGCSALSSAVRAESHSIALVQVLIAAGADVNDKPEHPLIIAAVRTGNIFFVQLLLATGANVNAADDRNRTALGVAIKLGYNFLVQVLLDAGADINALSPRHGRVVLQAAVKKNDIDLVRKLLYAGAKVDVIHSTWVTNALPLAVEVGNVGMVQLLIEADADVNASAYKVPGDIYDETMTTALLSATWRGSAELVEMLLNAGANANARPQPSGGWTALQAAAHSGNSELVKILLDAGADINAPAYEDSGRTALQAAVVEGHTELARRLLEAGADVNAPAAKSRGITALQGAAIKGQLGFALKLIEAGADPNAPPAKYQGRTALQGAAEHGRLDMLQLLLNAGADIGGSHPARARGLAERNGHVVIAEFLKKF